MRSLSFVLGLMAMVGIAGTSYAHGADGKPTYHCEIKKGGKLIDDPDIKDRKTCKAKGGKWVKEHDHDHDHSGHSHD